MPSGAPGNVTAVVLNSRSIEITWEAPQMNEQNGEIQYYLIMVMIQQSRSSLSFNTSSHSLVIPDLHPAYVHSVEVAAVTIIGVGPFSSVVSITTPDDGK